MQTAEGTRCTSGTLREEYSSSIKNVTTKITYQLPQQNLTKTLSNASVSNANITDVTDIESYQVNEEVHSEYGRSQLVVESSYENCTDIVSSIEAHMIRMYDKNPIYNSAFSIAIAYIWHSVTLTFTILFFCT